VGGNEKPGLFAMGNLQKEIVLHLEERVMKTGKRHLRVRHPVEAFLGG